MAAELLRRIVLTELRFFETIGASRLQLHCFNDTTWARILNDLSSSVHYWLYEDFQTFVWSVFIEKVLFNEHDLIVVRAEAVVYWTTSQVYLLLFALANIAERRVRPYAYVIL